LKAVIVECSNGAAVALCDDGTFRKLKNKNYSIGQELVLKKRRSANHTAQKLSICASLALFLLSFVGFESYSYVKPYSYVSLDINPSIEYALNRYDKVISVAGINDDGQQVVSSIESDIKNRNITTALGVTLKQLEKDHYISQEENNHVIISVCSNNDTKARSIASRVDSFSETESQMCSIDTVTVSQETKDNADSLGITPGKLALIKAVEETTSDSNFDVSQWTDKTVSELETTIQQASNQSPDGNTDPGTDTVIDSEYLSSVLDETTTDISDSTATASATEADTESSSASTDKTTNNNAATVADSDSPDSTAKQDGGTSTTDNGPVSAADGSSTSKTDGNADSGKPGSTAAGGNTGTNSAGGREPADNSSTNKDSSDKNTSNKDTSDKDTSNQNSNQGTSGSQSAGSSADTSKKPSDSNSSSKQPASEGPDNSAMSEESSSKKDSYPAGGTKPADTEEPEPDKTGDASGPETGTDQTGEDIPDAPGHEPQTVDVE